MTTTYKKLDADFKTKWLDALRSDRYTQATGALQRWENGQSVGFCCLGVACDLIDPDQWDYSPIEDPEFEYLIGWGPTGAEGTDLPFIDRRTGMQLANMNDGLADFIDNPHTFALVADWIEENL